MDLRVPPLSSTTTPVNPLLSPLPPPNLRHLTEDEEQGDMPDGARIGLTQEFASLALDLDDNYSDDDRNDDGGDVHEFP